MQFFKTSDDVPVDDLDDVRVDDMVRIKKSSARRSLESQFSATSDHQRSLERHDCEIDSEENVPLQAGINGSPSRTGLYEKLPARTPSFRAAVSDSSTTLDLDLSNQGSDCKILGASPWKKSKTPTKSVSTLPSTSITPVPKDTSTPGPSHGIDYYPEVHVSISSESAAICRICHEGDEHEGLLSPCYCTGSVGMLHLSCLELWLGTSNTTRCEICKYEFKVSRKARSLWDFVKHSRSGGGRKNLICDVICFFILTPLTVLSAYLCLNGVNYYSKWNDRWEVPGLVCLTISLLMIFVIWCIIAVRHHLMMLFQWRKHNQIIKIVYLSPIKGKAFLKATPPLDRNQNHVRASPWQNSRQPTPVTSSRSCSITMSVTSSHADVSTSYHAAMMRPILKYSTNVESCSYQSQLESESHVIKCMPSDKTPNLSSPLVKPDSVVSEDSHVCKETCI